MTGFQINFSAMNTAMTHFDETLQEIQKEMKEIETIKTTTLSDSIWKGQKKSEYIQSLEKYQLALDELYRASCDHLVKLNEIVKLHVNAEIS